MDSKPILSLIMGSFNLSAALPIDRNIIRIRGGGCELDH